MAEYEADGAFIKSRDFTDNARVDFESAAGIIGTESDYVKIYEALWALRPDIAEQFVLMCYFDGLIYNMDRHENNFGVLRDNNTGEILSFAPFYDHNIALVSRGYPDRAPNDILISDFAALIRYVGKAIHMRELTMQDVFQLVQSVPFEPPVTDAVSQPREFTARYLLQRQKALEEQSIGLVRLTPLSIHD